jgi:hypothetical protein
MFAVPRERVDVDGFQCGEQLSLLVIKRGEERRASQRADIVIVLSRPIDFSCRQRRVLDTAHTDESFLALQQHSNRRTHAKHPKSNPRDVRRSILPLGFVVPSGSCLPPRKRRQQSHSHAAILVPRFAIFVLRLGNPSHNEFN